MALLDSKGSWVRGARGVVLFAFGSAAAVACATGGGSAGESDGSGAQATTTGAGGNNNGSGAAAGVGGMSTTSSATGGATTTTTGAGGMCSEDPCKLTLPQCGCPTGDKCQWTSGTRSCVPDGSVAPGQICNNDCAAGALCINYGGAPQLCKKFCDTDAECAAPGGICILQINDPQQNPYPERWCSDNCDPISGAGCPGTTKCELLQEADGLMRNFTTCVPAGTGTQLSTCTDILDCASGFSCFNTNPNLQCLQWCNVASPSCGNCSPLSPAIYIGSVQYGVCF